MRVRCARPPSLCGY